MNLSQRLKILRKNKELTQKQLANQLNCSRTTLANYEQGNRLPNIHFLNEIANYFEIPLDFLINEDTSTKGLIPILSQQAVSPILLIECDEGRIIDVNDKAVEFYGYSRKELLDMKVWQLNTFTKKETLKFMSDILDNNVKSKFFIKHKISNGTIKSVEINSEPIYCNNKTYLYSTIYEVTNFFNLDNNINQLASSFIFNLILNLEYSISYLTNHLKKVTSLSVQIGKKLNLPQFQLDNIKVAAQLHDIGLLNIPKDIINKPGQLNKAEYDIIKQHPIKSNKILKNLNLIEPIPNIVLQHHENIDGSGYPHGLRGVNIHIESKILRVADVVEAMISNRPYRNSYDKLTILNEIQEQKGQLYDPNVVDATLDLFLNENYNFK